jgi:hypothetical protein
MSHARAVTEVTGEKGSSFLNHPQQIAASKFFCANLVHLLIELPKDQHPTA